MDGTISCRLGRRKPTRQRDENDFLQVSQFSCLYFEFFFEFNVASLQQSSIEQIGCVSHPDATTKKRKQKTLREKKREKRRKKEAKKSIENDKEEMKTSNVKKEKIQKGLKENKSAMLIKRRQSKDILSLATIYWQQLSKYLMSRAMTFIQSEIDEILSFHCISSQDFSRRPFSTSLCPRLFVQ
jgi:hypothetical protein